MKSETDRSQEDSLYRSWKKSHEITDHVVTGCSRCVQKEYEGRLKNLGNIIHWKVAENYNFEVKDNWYVHEHKSVAENELYKVLWNFNIQADYIIKSWTPDLVVVDKK